MFGKFTGYYHFSSLKAYLFPDGDTVSKLSTLLPVGNVTGFFANGRDAIYHILMHHKALNGGTLKAVVPAWTCNILYSVLESAGSEIIPMDVDPESLKMSIDDIINNSPDIVLLVAENGAIYSDEEVSRLKNAGITVIGDYTLALRSLDLIRDQPCDYFVFSGGFSKPVSSVGLGIMITDHPLKFPAKWNNSISLKNIFLMIIHLMLQVGFIYKLVSGLLKEPMKEHFSPQDDMTPNLRNASVLLNELNLFHTRRSEWKELQSDIYGIIGGGSPVELRTKILLPQSCVIRSNSIHFHNQYVWTKTADPNGSLNGVSRINSEYISLALNGSCLDRKDEFLRELKKSLRPC